MTHVDSTGCNLTQADFGDDTEPCPDGGMVWEHPALKVTA